MQSAVCKKLLPEKRQIRFVIDTRRYKYQKKNSQEELEFATVQVPQGLPRYVEVPGTEGMRYIILLENIIETIRFSFSCLIWVYEFGII